VWGSEQENPIPHGAVVALLNPALLPGGPRSGAAGDADGRASARVSYDTQVVILGVCPSLGYCSATKKDGMKCSMPCDRDRGLHVCYFHNLQKHARQVNQWKNGSALPGSASVQGGGLQGGAAQRAPCAGVAVIEKKQLPKSAPSQGAQPQRTGTAQTAGGVHRSRPTTVDKSDVAVARLLAAPLGRRQESMASKSAAASRSAASASRIGTSMVATSSLGSSAPTAGDSGKKLSASSVGTLVPAVDQGGSSVDNNKGSTSSHDIPASVRRRLESAEEIDMATVAKLRSKFPKGLSAPDAQDRYIPIPLGQPLYEGTVVVAHKRNPGLALTTKKRVKKIDPLLGGTALVQVDPRKDSVRLQRSRHASLVDQERAAKRHRMLAEFEAQDAASEQMAAVMSVNVSAWKCQECKITFDSSRRHSDCISRNHSLTVCKAVKTKWECIECKVSVNVFDRDLPESCHACGGKGWRQLPLQGKARTAPMERDLLLPRGEELPFLNSISIPGRAAGRDHTREDVDPYSALNHNVAG